MSLRHGLSSREDLMSCWHLTGCAATAPPRHLLAARPAPLVQVGMAPRARGGGPSHTGPDARLALRESLAGLAVPDLQQQSAFAAEALLQQAEGPLIDFFIREALRLGDCQSGSVRRLRYR